MPLREHISIRGIAAAILVVIYAAFALRQIEPVTVMYFVAVVTAALLLILPTRLSVIRIAGTAIAYVLFVVNRVETRRIVMATAVLVWVIATAYFARRLDRLGQTVGANLVGVISDLWLIAMLTLLALESYIVSGLLLISVASWIPRAGKTKVWVALVFALLGGWLIIAAKLDFDLELRRWYLLGALALGIFASLLVSAQEVEQREDVHPQ